MNITPFFNHFFGGLSLTAFVVLMILRTRGMRPRKPPERNKLAYSFEAQKLSTDSNLVKTNRQELENQVIIGENGDP